MSRAVQRQVEITQELRLRRVGTSRERVDSSDQLRKVQRLPEIVVGAEREALHAVAHGTGGGQHQHSALGSLGEEGATDLVTVGAGQVPNQDDDVVDIGAQALESVAAVEGD